jgi:hypothetical protein
LVGASRWTASDPGCDRRFDRAGSLAYLDASRFRRVTSDRLCCLVVHYYIGGTTI